MFSKGFELVCALPSTPALKKKVQRLVQRYPRCRYWWRRTWPLDHRSNLTFVLKTSRQAVQCEPRNKECDVLLVSSMWLSTPDLVFINQLHGSSTKNFRFFVQNRIVGGCWTQATRPATPIRCSFSAPVPPLNRWNLDFQLDMNSPSKAAPSSAMSSEKMNDKCRSNNWTSARPHGLTPRVRWKIMFKHPMCWTNG